MVRITPISTSSINEATKATLTAVKEKMGMVPNLIATLARTPAALSGYLGFSDALGQGKFTASEREIIALAVAQANGCHYCLSAHTMIAKSTGLSEQDILDARSGSGNDSFNKVIASFAAKVANQRGALSDAELVNAREMGIDDDMMIEIVANVAFNTLTNFTNNLANTEIDFPVVSTNL